MNARWLTLATLVSLGAFASVFAVGVAPAIAAPPQFAPGQVIKPMGVAVDQAAGNDVYIADYAEGQIDAFDGSGSLVAVFGKALFGKSPGLEGYAGPAGLAVDNELSSLSYGDVYVVDWDHHRVDKFDSSGKFLLMFGGDVNEKTGGNVCVEGEACKAGTSGTADGQFEWAFEKSFIAVGVGGRVYVGDRARVQVFESSGVWRENISLSGLSATGRVTALAVDSTGDMFVKDEGVAGVREFEPNGTEKGTQFDVGSESVQVLEMGGSGELFVADSSGGGHVLEYDSAGKKLASFGSNTPEFARGMAYASALGKLYVSDSNTVWVLTPPVSGPPTIEEGSVSAVGSPRGHASLTAKLNPGGFETTYHFEYVDEAGFQASGYANASSSPAVSVAQSLELQSVNAALTGLAAAATYHYRLVAISSKGTATSPDQTFEETPAALIKGPWVTNVAATSATVGAEVDPLGAGTEYRLEYGTTTSYGQVVSGSVGGGEAFVPVTIHSQELSPGTVYHYRIVTHNEVGTVESVDHSFATQSVSAGSVLADGRVWELVSPANKKGAAIEFFDGGDLTQAANDGSGITYLTEGPHVGEGALGKIKWAQVLSRRGPDGWGSEDLTLPGNLPAPGETYVATASQNPEYRLFSSDLSLAGAEPQPFERTSPLSHEATTRTLYLRDDANRSFVPLVTSANVPPGTTIEEPFVPGAFKEGSWEMHFDAATPDLSHVVFSTPVALTPAEGLTPAAIDEEGVGKRDPRGEPQFNLYEWSEGKLQLVNVLPNNEATHDPPVPSVSLAGSGHVEGYRSGGGPRAVSSNGRRIAWSWGERIAPSPNAVGQEDLGGAYKGLYVRDMVEERTVQVGGPEAVFQVMNNDGSRIFYLEKGDLHMFDYGTGTQTDLTAAHGPGESSAGVEEAVSDVSEDGSYVYFVARGVLANGGVAGENNLYLLHDTGGGWQTTHVATLSQEDQPSWYAQAKRYPDLTRVSSRVSPDGRYLTFMSSRSLTGYDNIDVNSGAPDQEVYLYDAETGKLMCASCDPTGARPVGVFDSRQAGLLVDHGSTWGGSEKESEKAKTQWLAGSIPSWNADNPARSTTHQPRYLNNSGRLFFNSSDTLVPQDTNGLEDVYEYEPVGIGSCVVTSVTFSERSGGCVSLVSSGASGAESAFYDASESGGDAFFITKGRLVGEDYDNGYDVYDAHVCSLAVPCKVVPVSSPACTSGDSCKAAPSPQPEIFGPAPSATFNGIGNVIASHPAPVVGPRSLSNAQRLTGALRACHKKRGKRRGVCEAQAHKRYPLKRAGKAARATLKGNG